jgi:hypothetical protein
MPSSRKFSLWMVLKIQVVDLWDELAEFGAGNSH